MAGRAAERAGRKEELSGRAGAGLAQLVDWPQPRGLPSRASPAGTLAMGTYGARSAGPRGSGMKVASLDGHQLRKMLHKEAAARCVVLLTAGPSRPLPP